MALPTIFSRLAGEDDGLGVFVSYGASMTCCVFFAVINDAGDYPILSAYRACRDARRRVETGVSPTPKGGCGGHPPHIRAYTRNRFFAYQPQVTRRREPPPMPFAHRKIYCAQPHSACTRKRFFAYQPQVTRRRSRRRCPSHTTVIGRSCEDSGVAGRKLNDICSFLCHFAVAITRRLCVKSRSFFQ